MTAMMLETTPRPVGLLHTAAASAARRLRDELSLLGITDVVAEHAGSGWGRVRVGPYTLVTYGGTYDWPESRDPLTHHIRWRQVPVSAAPELAKIIKGWLRGAD